MSTGKISGMIAERQRVARNAYMKEYLRKYRQRHADVFQEREAQRNAKRKEYFATWRERKAAEAAQHAAEVAWLDCLRGMDRKQQARELI